MNNTISIESKVDELISLFGEYEKLIVVRYNGQIDFPEEFEDMGFMEDDNGYDISIDAERSSSPCEIIRKSPYNEDIVRLNEFILKKANQGEYEFFVLSEDFVKENILKYSK